MKQIKNYLLLFLLAASLLFFSCNAKNSNANSEKNSSAEVSASGATSAGDASFSVIIDGKEISGNVIDEMQLQNTAFIYPETSESPKRLLFFLYSNKQGTDFYSFRFSFPDKEGTYKFTRESDEDCHCYIRLDNNLKSADNFSRYDEDSVTVVIDKITSTRISGTFAGILRLSDDTRSKPYAKQVTITDGKFDIPFSTGNIKPE